MRTFQDFLAESIPPGMDQWVTDNTEAFKANHGDEWEMYLLSTAWTIYRKHYVAPALDLS